MFSIALGVSVPSIFCTSAAAQSAGLTQTEVWPELEAHLQLDANFRALVFAGLQQGFDYPFQQAYGAAGLGYQFKPILKPHRVNIDPDKEHFLLVGAGYEFLRTLQSGQLKDEDRLDIEAIPSFRPVSLLLVRDRNRVELRWINGEFSTTYRNLLSAEGEFSIREIRLSPYVSAEAFYDGSKHFWNQEWYTVGIQWPYRRMFMVDTYYRRENCYSCKPENWNVGGITLNFYFRNDPK